MTKMATVHAQQLWEYQCIQRNSESYLLNELNDLGREGWELIGTQFHKNMKGVMVWTAFLKRPSAAARPKEAAAAAQPRGEEPQPEAPRDGEGYKPKGFDLSDGEFELKD
jgi:hypothetical protein